MHTGEKGISDSVHGTIELNEVETRLVSTPAFQRLRAIKQLGLGYMVFPGADYSRFSHSLGACHVTQQLVQALGNAGVEISDDEQVRYRLAGLLHDIGHYPFSHALEDAIADHYASHLIQADTPSPDESPAKASIPESWLDHESVGKAILTTDPEIVKGFAEFGISPESVYRIFTREEPPRFSNLISSDLDADRIDFLLRTAHQTGLPYGRVDLPYLLSQIRVDSSERICLHPKALRTADHFLLGRYFDYQSVAFHKTVAALELVLKDVLRALLESGALDCSKSAIKAKIASGEWLRFDDAEVIRLMRELSSSTADKIIRAKAESILFRRPPKLVYQLESLEPRCEASDSFHSFRRKVLTEKIPVWAEKFGIPEKLWYVWDHSGRPLTSIGSTIPVGEEIDADKAEQSIRILNPEDQSSTPIGNMKNSLMRVLANHSLYSVRVYVVFPPDIEKLRGEIAAFLKSDVEP